jgi:HEAT repeat protein
MRRKAWRSALLLAILAGPSFRADEGQLEKMGRQVAERAAKDLKSKDAQKRRDAARSLSGWKSATAAALLVQGLDDPDGQVRAGSACAL